LLSQKGMWT